ncbi:hypothetical protein DSO57_1016838 [Entomophthora muscae]|uniref:Uncharacterized protein n=1 Tax=Entomophthora muscae TaxID=34485 RepID=A0ACC2UPK3_9FUNG|nr:hypothetical protein DSO57_1016838 [Entomophthora muscae]
MIGWSGEPRLTRGLISAASSIASNGTKEIEIKDNLNYVLKLGTCEQKAEIVVKINDGTKDLPYLYPKFETGDATVATIPTVTKSIADIIDRVQQNVTRYQEFLDKIVEFEIEIGSQTNDATKNLKVHQFKIEFAGAKIASLTESVKKGITELSDNLVGTSLNVVSLAQYFTDLKAAFKKSISDSLESVKGNLAELEHNILPVSSDVKQKLTNFVASTQTVDGFSPNFSTFFTKFDELKNLDVISHDFPGHFKIPDFKLKAIKLEGGKKTDFEVYVSPPNAHESANIKEPVTFEVDVNFICGAAKNETTKYKFTVTSNARAVSLVSSAAVLAATFFFIL